MRSSPAKILLTTVAIAAALASTGGNKLATSRLLGISRATLYERIGSGAPQTPARGA